MLLLVFLTIFKVLWHFMKEKSSVFFVSESQILFFIRTSMELELTEHKRTRCEVEGQTWFVGLVEEVPNVDSVRLGNENNSRTRRREGSASIMSSKSGSRYENRFIVFFKVYFPNSKLEIVDSEKQIGVERRPLKSKGWSVLFHEIKGLFHVLCYLWSVIVCCWWLHTPVNKNQRSFIRDCPELWQYQVFLEKNSA